MVDGNVEEKRKSQTVAEFKISQAIMDAVSSKMNKMSEDESKSFELGEAEKSVLMNINNVGLLQGAMAGAVALIALRRVRKHLFGRMMEQYEKQNTPTATKSQSPTAGPSSPFRQKKNPLEMAASSPVWVGLGWVTDLAASFMVAVSISVAFTDQKKILEQLSELPLVEGKSHVSRVFCPVIQETLAKMKEEASTKEQKVALSQPRTPYLAAWIAFSQNCGLRQAQEQLIRREKGLGEQEVVSIPAPGVSKPGEYSNGEFISELDSDGDATTGTFGDFYDPRDGSDSGSEFEDIEGKNDSQQG